MLKIYTDNRHIKKNLEDILYFFEHFYKGFIDNVKNIQTHVSKKKKISQYLILKVLFFKYLKNYGFYMDTIAT